MTGWLTLLIVDACIAWVWWGVGFNAGTYHERRRNDERTTP